MTPEILKAYQQHAQTLIDILEEVQSIASECNVETFLSTARDGLTSIVRAVEPRNELAIAMIQDTTNIDCEIDQSSFLGNIAAAILNTINSQLETVITN